MNGKAARWYQRYIDGDSFGDIAISEGTSRGAVSGTVNRYMRANSLPRREIVALRRVKPATPSSFSEAVERQTCLFITGDLKDGTATFCGVERVPGKRLCHEHCLVTYMKPRKAGFAADYGLE